LQDAEQGAGGSLVHPQQAHHLSQDLVLGTGSQREIDRILGEKVPEAHVA
jgi:hypothetical protein